MDIKIRRLSADAVLPVRAHKSDAGLDLTCTKIESGVNDAREMLLVYHTDLAVEIPEGYVGLIFPRSSIYTKSISQTNCVGVVDSNYRGELRVVFRPTISGVPEFYKVGERFAQLVIVPYLNAEVVEAEELSESERGENGFGSTGNTNEDISAPEAPSQQESVDDAKVDTQSADTAMPEVAAGDEDTPEQV